MPVYEFTLILRGDDLLAADKLDKLFEAGCDDATFGATGGVYWADFAREAGSYGMALFSAMANIRDADVGARIIRVEPDELVTLAEIAQRFDRSVESVRLLAEGLRGSGDFPAPVSHLRSRSKLWRWPEVQSWALEHDVTREIDLDARDRADETQAFNALLQLRSSRDRLSDDFWMMLEAELNDDERRALG